jgi:hypothetical protein
VPAGAPAAGPRPATAPRELQRGTEHRHDHEVCDDHGEPGPAAVLAGQQQRRPAADDVDVRAR